MANCADISGGQLVILTKEPTFFHLGGSSTHTQNTVVHHQLFDGVILNASRWLCLYTSDSKHNRSTNSLQDLHSSPLSTITVPDLTNQNSVYFFSYRALLSQTKFYSRNTNALPSIRSNGDGHQFKV